MNDHDTNRRAAKGTEQKANEQCDQVEPRKLGAAIVTGAVAVVGFLTGVSGHWFDWWFIALFIPAMLIGVGRSLHESLKHKSKWSDDNVFVVSWMLPMFAAALIAFAYLLAWPAAEALTPTSLSQLFKNDFRKNLTTRIQLVYRASTNHAPIGIDGKTVHDFDAGIRYLAFYIPVTTHTYAACRTLADEAEKAVRSADGLVEIIGRKPGDATATPSSQLVFSKRVFIYHEAPMDVQELASLQRVFESKGLNAQFRGLDYLFIKTIQKPDSGAKGDATGE